MNNWDYNSLIQEIHWLELKLDRITNTIEYLYIIKPPFYRATKQKDWRCRFCSLIVEEKEVLNLLIILYTELEKLL